jgi:tRNA (pseudouridine54-N1)-methyltransferase
MANKMREFILYSRLGRTDAKWKNLHDAGRLDIVYECAVASLFLSHAIRKDVVFHAVLNGPPSPPVHLKVDGLTLHDVRTDQQTWTNILKKVLAGKNHPGVSTEKLSFEALLREKAQNAQIYVLEEGGKDIFEIEIGENPVFILGDHVGLPRKVETFALRYGEKVSLGKKPYLAATCVTVLNYLLDRRELSQDKR